MTNVASENNSVSLFELLRCPEVKTVPDPLLTVLGSNAKGEPVICDLRSAVHLLAAGKKDTGVSDCVHSIICSLLHRASSKEVRLVLIDPGDRGMRDLYCGAKHLLYPVIVDDEKAAGTMAQILQEMDARYERLRQAEVRDIVKYCQSIKDTDAKMPYIVVVLNELADLMKTRKNETERFLHKAGTLGRAAGIHIVAATQEPTEDVLTGIIRNSIPARAVFSVDDKKTSRLVIDAEGAEKLTDPGEMFYKEACMIPVQANVCSLSPAEIVSSVSFRDILKEAAEYAVKEGKISTSMLQRKFAVGYARAGRLMDQLEQLGVIGQADGAKPRKILMTEEEYRSRFMADEP